MKVLITGTSGFIGHHVALEFQRKGYDVVGWDRVEANTGFPTMKIDMFDVEEVAKLLSFSPPDIIIHCAGLADVGKSVANPIMDYHSNVTITHDLLFTLHKLGLEKTRFVFLSSAGVYGNPVSLPITEDMLLNPLSPYAVHKVMCEDICKYFSENYKMNVKVARVFSAYGVGLKKQIFWDMYQKQKKTGQLNMFGTGNESRDFIHVDDVIQALFLLATTDSQYVTYNVANGMEVTIKEVVKMFAEAVGIMEENITFNGVVREGDPLNWRADITRIQELGYKRTVDMQKGIEEYVKWVKDQV